MRKTIVANWKMNPENLAEAKKLFAAVKKIKFDTKKVSVVVCPPAIYLPEIARNYRGKSFQFGAQNVIWSENQKKSASNALTGEISAEMIKDAGAEYVLVGHAERRAIGENNMMAAKKAEQVLRSGMTPLICVGEIERDLQGEYLKFLEEEIRETFSKVKKNQVRKTMIVYEPVWTIGAGHSAMSEHEIYQMVIFIRKILVSIFGRSLAMSVPILYGGSVDNENSKNILAIEGIEGLLVGRASLHTNTFSEILKNI